MNNSEQFKTFAKSKYAWPGGYPLFAITNDGGCLCHKCSKDNYRLIREAQKTIELGCSGWSVVAVDVNWEDSELYCDNCSETIESAYGE